MTRLPFIIVIAWSILVVGQAAEPASIENTQLPPDSQYVVVDADGHLSVDGERQRYWAAIGKVHADNRESTDALLDRFETLGFNAFRFWTGFRGESTYTPGDGSEQDQVDYFMTEASKRGFRIWLAAMNRVGDARPDDVGIIHEPATAEAWADAVAEMCKIVDGQVVEGRRLRPSIEKIWDPRMEKLLIRDMIDIATHRNAYTGLRWCDDPVFAVWELSNEEWWMRKMVGGRWQKLSAFFRNSLIARWNAFVRDKYGTPQKLAEAWDGLLEGEALSDGTILLAPMAGETSPAVGLNDASPHAAKAIVALADSYSRDDFNRQRGADVLEFFMDLQLTHKRRVAAAIKPLGKSTRLSPMIYDTGIGYEIQSQYLHQNAEAVAHDAYVNGFGPAIGDLLAKVDQSSSSLRRKLAQLEAERMSANDGPWVNWLLKPPGIALGVPWLEHNKVEGKPFLCYETQIQQPAKYRADFPLRLLALASIQDWDWVSWHYFGDNNVNRAGIEERPFDRRLDITTGRHPQGYHYTYDEVQSAMMRAAGHIFTGQMLTPAENPTIFVYGRRSLYDPASMDYAGSYGATGLDMLQTVYQHGVRIRIDPTREDDQVIGPVVKFQDRHTHNPYTPTDQIRFDWKTGYLKIDAPAVVAFAGLFSNVGNRVQFEHSVALTDVAIAHPEGIYDPVTEKQNYIAFALHSLDGKPLSETQHASMSIVSTSFNTAFEFGSGEWATPYRSPAGTKAGRTPVLVARVAGTIHAPVLDGMRYRLLDWHLKEIGRGTVTDSRFKIASDLPVFVVEFQR